MSLSVVILAAGQGKRMRSRLPKVLQPLAGRPLLAHVIERARSLDADAVHVVFGHGGDAVREAFDDPDIAWHEQAEQLGTGHAVAQAMPAITDDHQVLVLYGDVPLIGQAALESLLDAAKGTGLALLTAELELPAGYGRILRNADGGVAAIVEEADASEAERLITEINTGIMAASAAKLRGWIERLEPANVQKEYLLTDVVAFAAADGVTVTGIAVADPDEAFGINDKIQLAATERLYQRRAADALMRAGVSLADPGRIDIRGSLETGSDVFIDVGAVFSGTVVLGDGCEIGANAWIRNAEIGAGTVIHPNSVIDEAVIGSRCEVGPFARLRPGTRLAETVKVGNFVETKKAVIGTGSKVNHLSYVGDATIGADVNVGAGTITCNYDGANKHRTTIGDDVFVGSGVNLVAPIEIGAGATIGAGSTLTKNAPPGELSIARQRQTSVPHWKRPTRKPST